MANRNWSNGGKIWMMESYPVRVNCTFQVASSDSGGLGIINLKGPAVKAVYMQTSATKAAGSPGGSTGPAAGVIVLQLQDGFNRLLNMSHSIQSPNSGSDLKIDNSALTAGVAYVITTLGNATAAQWQALGVPPGIVPAVGVSFIAANAGGSANTSTSRVQIAADAGSGIFSIEEVGNPNLSIAPNPQANQGFGAQLILECRKDSSADAPTVAAPADGSVISLSLLLSNSSVQVQGE